MTCFLFAGDRLALEQRVAAQGQRIGKALKAIKGLMTQRRHQDLFYAAQALLPSVYDFEHAAMLFYEEEGACLYSINCDASARLSEENIIRLPKNMGLTGKAVAARCAVSFPAG